VDRYFWDSYALVERQRGNPAYEGYSGTPIFTHQMNVLEFISAVVRDYDEATAREQVRLLAANLLEADTDDLFVASSFRRAYAKRRISYVDALGYVLAKKHGIPFLTGDKMFKGIDGVEHVAK
jgi:predicted nucleic acid-binding protein